VLAQHTQHPPLLVRQAVLAQARAGVLHHGLARLQQQARQVAVGKGRGGGLGGSSFHLFNILNDLTERQQGLTLAIARMAHNENAA
jgi:mevalonate kinase